MAIKSLLITTYPTSQNRMAPSEPPLANSFSCIGCHDTATESKRVSYLHTYLAVERVGETERENSAKDCVSTQYWGIPNTQEFNLQYIHSYLVCAPSTYKAPYNRKPRQKAFTTLAVPKPPAKVCSETMGRQISRGSIQRSLFATHKIFPLKIFPLHST